MSAFSGSAGRPSDGLQAYFSDDRPAGDNYLAGAECGCFFCVLNNMQRGAEQRVILKNGFVRLMIFLSVVQSFFVLLVY